MHHLPAASPFAAQAQGGGVDWFLIVLLAAMALMFLFTVTRGRKAQQEQAAMRARLAPGDEVMTGAGIFGHVRSIDEQSQRVTLELSPATFADVHLQTISRIVEDESGQQRPAVEHDADATVRPDVVDAEGSEHRDERPRR